MSPRLSILMVCAASLCGCKPAYDSTPPNPGAGEAPPVASEPAASDDASGTAAGSEVATSTEAPEPSVWTLSAMAAGAVKMPDLGPVHRQVTTTSAEAQAYFDQGLALA